MQPNLVVPPTREVDSSVSWMIRAQQKKVTFENVICEFLLKINQSSNEEK